MRLNEDGFPDYLEVREKFDLEHNKELAKYIDYMYRKYYELVKATFQMSPQTIRHLEELDSCLRDKYFDELLGCRTAELEDKMIIRLFGDEPDKQAAVQKLCDIYMKECSNHFRYEMQALLEEK